MKLRCILLLILALICAPAIAQVTPGTSPLSVVKGGTGTNGVVNTKISNYTIAATDCGIGKTIQAGTGSTGFFTVTAPSVSGFAASCVVTITNGDTGRGKALTGFPTGTNSILWPGQAISIGVVNGAWAVLSAPGRYVANSAITVFIDPTNGNDANDCIAATTGACATGTQAMSIVANQFVNNSATKIKWANATYANSPFVALPWIGIGSVALEGNITTPSNVSFTISSAGNCIFCFISTGRDWALHGFTISSSVGGNGNGVLVQGDFSTVTYGNMNFGAFAGGSMVVGIYGAHTETDANNTISGGAACYLSSQDQSVLHDTVAVNTITGTPTFSSALLCAHGAGALIGVNTTTFSGPISGLSCKADDLALIDGVAANMPGTGTCQVQFAGLAVGISANPTYGGPTVNAPGGINFNGTIDGTASVTADPHVASTAYKIGKAGSGYLLGVQRTVHGDANVTLTIADCPFTQLNAGLSAPRTWQLPLSAAFPSGGWTCTINGSGGIGGTNTLSITSQGGDTFSGPGVSGNAITLSNLVATITVVNDGASSWSLYSITPVSIGSVAGLGTGNATMLGAATGSNGGPTQTIASGATAMGTGAISSATCATVVTATATNTATTDVVTASFNGDPTAVTGYVPLTTGALTIYVYPTANTANFKVCNYTNASITPGAITLNWRVVR